MADIFGVKYCRSAKFLLQFISSFLQSIKDKKLNQEELDMYSTIVLYFNSRELHQ